MMTTTTWANDGARTNRSNHFFSFTHGDGAPTFSLNSANPNIADRCRITRTCTLALEALGGTF
jgi:hypothetical protein